MRAAWLSTTTTNTYHPSNEVTSAHSCKKAILKLGRLLKARLRAEGRGAVLQATGAVIHARQARFVHVAVPFVPRFVEVLVGHIDCDQERVELFGIGVPPRAGPAFNGHIYSPHHTRAAGVPALTKEEAKEANSLKDTKLRARRKQWL